MATDIFISYRRDDSAGYARAIYDRLVKQFPPERVFLDVDAIEPGLPFDEVIGKALDRSAILLLMIGKRWLEPQGGAGSRLNDPGDFVRFEVAAALSRNIRLVPVLLDGARMPSENDLPEPIRALARRNALEVSNTRFASDVERLVDVVREVVQAAAQRDQPEVSGKWKAEVTYDWPNAHYVEEFEFEVDDGELFGTASFLQRKRAISEGAVEKDRIRFATRTQEVLGDSGPRETVHRYRGKLSGNEIRFTMQTEGGFSEHVPVSFVAKKI